MNKRYVLPVAILSAVVVGALIFQRGANDEVRSGNENASLDTALVQIILPETISAYAEIGERAFEAKCASCHGVDGVGRNGAAPPLIHKIYEPSHHGDESFQRAVSLGVRSHHWPFGDMPPVAGLTRAEVTMIIAYIREIQQANGIN